MRYRLQSKTLACPNLCIEYGGGGVRHSQKSCVLYRPRQKWSQLAPDVRRPTDHHPTHPRNHACVNPCTYPSTLPSVEPATHPQPTQHRARRGGGGCEIWTNLKTNLAEALPRAKYAVYAHICNIFFARHPSMQSTAAV